MRLLPDRSPALFWLWRGWAVLSSLSLGCCCAWAQDVSLVGLSAGKALLVVDGAPPRFWSPGQSQAGVRLLNVGVNQATVEVQGQRLLLNVGQAPLRAQTVPTDTKLVLYAEAEGHFFGNGAINNQATRFIVDTGATAVSISEREAKRLGIAYEQGQAVRIRTANGELVGHRISLTSVKLGPYTRYNVAAVVIPADMPFVLLGNSFLSQFSMLRENDRMTLTPQ